MADKAAQHARHLFRSVGVENFQKLLRYLFGLIAAREDHFADRERQRGHCSPHGHVMLVYVGVDRIGKRFVQAWSCLK